ncbi:hypothetical protein [Atopobium sp. oral taxon 416]|uniref:hypothetical protein n=1 Tax=Atopobium sp. oral taxon 416 TaxID=712157 RepID=UPI001BA65629|nr:hypothetical protein [Atopobium sp. oral taxon 416]QUC04625.1 hypothetical protein J4859_06825 [Atopobium sp. oral taxon 416]
MQRYVKEKRYEMAADRDAEGPCRLFALEWLPGKCQVDFGKADFTVKGATSKGGGTSP